MGIGILVGYFAKQKEARSALRSLKQHGFSQTVLVQKDSGGIVQIVQPLARRLPLRITLAACLGGGIAFAAALILQRLKVVPP